MKLKLFIFSFLLVCLYQHTSAQKNKRITIEGQVPSDYEKDSIDLTIYPVNRIAYHSKPTITKFQKNINGRAKWIFSVNEPNYVMGTFMNKSSRLGYHLEPGDSIVITYHNQKQKFAGRGIKKWELVAKLEEIDDSLTKTDLYQSLSNEHNPLKSLQDYINWHTYLNLKMNLMLPVIESYKRYISWFSYNTIKERTLYNIEEKKITRFFFLRGTVTDANKGINEFGLTNNDLCVIYDSTLNGPGAKWLQNEAPLIDDPYYLYNMVSLQAERETNQFFRLNQSDTSKVGKERSDRYVTRYNLAKRKFKGFIREEVLAFMFHYDRGFIYNAGFTPQVESILADYYKQPGYPEYKKAVKEYEMKRREKWNRKIAHNFSLTDKKGDKFSSEQLKGKVVIIDFWFTGCTGCVQMAPALRKVEEHFVNDTNILFVSVSIDKNKEQWIKSISQKKYTTGGGIQLYTGGKGSDHELIKKFLVGAYPTLEIIDPNGLFVKYDRRKTDPRRDDGQSMISLLRKQLAIMKDGPYVFYKDDKATSYIIKGDRTGDTKFTKENRTTLPVYTDLNTTFNISLKSVHNNEASEFARPEKLIVLSDIEGNFDQFRKLLQGNKIIDENYNWVFGNGHLVFSGDMFDRGNQVTECLWLIYSLEEKAKAFGGYVHFVLGNHEIMNLQGDHRYVDARYKWNAELIGKSLTELYGDNSELGRWLRSKNIIAKIGDLLFLHGGISKKLNSLPVTVESINELARPNYAKRDAINSNDTLVKTIFNDATSPFWYRAYYTDNKEKQKEVLGVIDNTLQKFNVNRIITGHTIVADTISVHYNNKIINTDTRHAEGKSEALLIEGDKFYRVNAEGKRVLLFIDDKRKQQL